MQTLRLGLVALLLLAGRGVAVDAPEPPVAEAQCFIVSYPDKHVLVLELRPPVAEVRRSPSAVLYMIYAI